MGEDDPLTLACRNNLADAYQAAGDQDQAIALHEQPSTAAWNIGEEHPRTLTSRNNLAHVYRGAGELDRAIAMFEKDSTARPAARRRPSENRSDSRRPR